MRKSLSGPRPRTVGHRRRTGRAVGLCALVILNALLEPTTSAQEAKPVLSECFVPEPELARQYKEALAHWEAASDHTERRVIYGCDDRKNFYDVRLDEHQRRAADATAMLVFRNQLVRRDRGARFDLPGTGAGLCSPDKIVQNGYDIPERFWNEPAPGFCSGFKVGHKLIATAAHCIPSSTYCRGNGTEEFPGVSFVFGFRMLTPETRPEIGLLKANIYQCVRVVGGSKNDRPGQADWRVVEVDREIDAPQVSISNSSITLSRGIEVTVIGYPLGLPVKISDNAVVDRVEGPIFVANLDTYGGNSGSAVFNSERLRKGDLQVEGILARGDEDFLESDFRCHVSKRCPDHGCLGERVTLISEIQKALPK
jgi:V8-like Glu-specific endopeptidase